MTPADIGRVLAKAAAYDQRTVGEGDILAWLEAVGDLDFGDALAAVTCHYRESTEWLRPAHVRRIVAELVRDRRRVAREARERDEAEQLAIARGPIRDRSAEVTALVQQVAAAFVTLSDAIHERAKLRAQRDNGRPERLKPVRRERKGKPKDFPEPQTDDIAALATRYLIDGHDPRDVAERLGVSRGWCRSVAARFTPGARP